MEKNMISGNAGYRMIMIRIFSKLYEIKRKLKTTNEIELYNRMMNDDLSYCCPICNSKKKFNMDGSYCRNFVYYSNQCRSSATISVVCRKCRECGHSHAVLPSVIVPYASFSVLFVIYLMSDYYLHTYKNINILCEKYDVAVSTFYRLLHIFQRDWERMLCSLLKMIDRVKEQDLMSRAILLLTNQEEYKIYSEQGLLYTFFMRYGKGLFQT